MARGYSRRVPILPIRLYVDWESERARKWGRTLSLEKRDTEHGLYSMAVYHCCTPIRSRSLWHSTARAFSSTSAHPDDNKWHRLLVQHHLQHHSSEAAIDSAEGAAQHAHNQLRWIRQAAADQAHVVDRMVTELVQLDKPLAYVLGQFPLNALYFIQI